MSNVNSSANRDTRDNCIIVLLYFHAHIHMNSLYLVFVLVVFFLKLFRNAGFAVSLAICKAAAAYQEVVLFTVCGAWIICLVQLIT